MHSNSTPNLKLKGEARVSEPKNSKGRLGIFENKLSLADHSLMFLETKSKNTSTSSSLAKSTNSPDPNSKNLALLSFKSKTPRATLPKVPLNSPNRLQTDDSSFSTSRAVQENSMSEYNFAPSTRKSQLTSTMQKKRGSAFIFEKCPAHELSQSIKPPSHRIPFFSFKETIKEQVDILEETMKTSKEPLRLIESTIALVNLALKATQQLQEFPQKVVFEAFYNALSLMKQIIPGQKRKSERMEGSGKTKQVLKTSIGIQCHVAQELGAIGRKPQTQTEQMLQEFKHGNNFEEVHSFYKGKLLLKEIEAVRKEEELKSMRNRLKESNLEQSQVEELRDSLVSKTKGFEEQASDLKKKLSSRETTISRLSLAIQEHKKALLGSIQEKEELKATIRKRETTIDSMKYFLGNAEQSISEMRERWQMQYEDFLAKSLENERNKEIIADFKERFFMNKGKHLVKEYDKEIESDRWRDIDLMETVLNIYIKDKEITLKRQEAKTNTSYKSELLESVSKLIKNAGLLQEVAWEKTERAGFLSTPRSPMFSEQNESFSQQRLAQDPNSEAIHLNPSDSVSLKYNGFSSPQLISRVLRPGPGKSPNASFQNLGERNGSYTKMPSIENIVRSPVKKTSIEIVQSGSSKGQGERVSLHKFIFWKPSFFSLVSHVFNGLSQELVEKFIETEVSFEYLLGVVRGVFDSKFNEFLLSEDPKTYTRFPEFVYGWLSKFEIDQFTKKVKAKLSNDREKEDLLCIKLLLQLQGSVFNRNWECQAFCEFLDGRSSSDEVYFYLYIRHHFLRSRHLDNFSATFNILWYLPLKTVESTLQRVLKALSPQAYVLILNKIKEKSKMKKKGKFQMVEMGFVLKLLLELYREEKMKKIKSIRKSFEEEKEAIMQELKSRTLLPAQLEDISLGFASVKRVTEHHFEGFCESEKAEIYFETWNMGRSKVNFENYVTVLNEKGYFTRFLRAVDITPGPVIDYSSGKPHGLGDDPYSQLCSSILTSYSQNDKINSKAMDLVESFGCERFLSRYEALENVILKKFQTQDGEMMAKTSLMVSSRLYEMRVASKSLEMYYQTLNISKDKLEKIKLVETEDRLFSEGLKETIEFLKKKEKEQNNKRKKATLKIIKNILGFINKAKAKKSETLRK